MKRFAFVGSVCALAAVVAITSGCAKKEQKAPATEVEAAAKSVPAEVSFAGQVMPLFERSCGGCHRREDGSAHAIEHGVFFETKEDVLGKVGKFIIAGRPDSSGLYKICAKEVPVGEKKILMPPPKSDTPPFGAEDLVLFARWITEGAKDN